MTTRTKKPRPIVPVVTNIHFTETERCKDEHGQWNATVQRVDIYHAGTLKINGRELKFVLHLMNCDGSIAKDRGRWHVCIDLNTDSECCHGCPECSGNHGVSTPETSGTTAIAVGNLIMPMVEKMGYKISLTDSRNRGNWFLFHIAFDSSEYITSKAARRRFFTQTHDRVVCPVHGEYTCITEEFNA